MPDPGWLRRRAIAVSTTEELADAASAVGRFTVWSAASGRMGVALTVNATLAHRIPKRGSEGIEKCSATGWVAKNCTGFDAVEGGKIDTRQDAI